LAAIRFRIHDLHANRLIYTHDKRQSQHFAQVFWTARQSGWANDVTLDYAPFGTMLGEDGKPFKTRSGDTVKLTELLDEAEERAFAVFRRRTRDCQKRQSDRSRTPSGSAPSNTRPLKDRVSDYVFSWDRMLAMDGNTARISRSSTRG